MCKLVHNTHVPQNDGTCVMLLAFKKRQNLNFMTHKCLTKKKKQTINAGQI